ncbi:hypothetical protein NL676_021290 [Syzygium grande]|nr:hypothetical protein NL676_021290 [Syzygium grande]
MTSFEMTFGQKPPSLLAYCAGTSAVEAVDHDLRSRVIILSQLRANLSKAQDLALDDSNWEDEHLLDNIRFEDKSSFYGARNVSSQGLQAYSRRKNMPKQG